MTHDYLDFLLPFWPQLILIFLSLFTKQELPDIVISQDGLKSDGNNLKSSTETTNNDESICNQPSALSNDKDNIDPIRISLANLNGKF